MGRFTVSLLAARELDLRIPFFCAFYLKKDIDIDVLFTSVDLLHEKKQRMVLTLCDHRLFCRRIHKMLQSFCSVSSYLTLMVYTSCKARENYMQVFVLAHVLGMLGVHVICLVFIFGECVNIMSHSILCESNCKIALEKADIVSDAILAVADPGFLKWCMVGTA